MSALARSCIISDAREVLRVYVQHVTKHVRLHVFRTLPCFA